MKQLLPLLLSALLLPWSVQAQPASPQSLSPQQVLELMRNQPPGTTFTVEMTNESAKGVGAGAAARGDGKISQDVTGTPPTAGLGGADDPSATGGGITSKTTIVPSDNAVRIALAVLGGLFLAGAAGVRMLPIPAPISVTTILATIGAGLIASALYPIATLFVLAGGLVALAWPAIQKSIQHRAASEKADTHEESTRALASGVDDFAKANPKAHQQLLGFIGSHATADDWSALRDVARADGLKFAFPD